MGVDRRRFFDPPIFKSEKPEDEPVHDPEFEQDFQRFMHGEEGVRPVNEEIERLYRHLKPQTPDKCPHGKTRLTCGECYINDRGRWI